MKNQSIPLFDVSFCQLYRVTEFPPQRLTGHFRSAACAAVPKFTPKMCGLTGRRSSSGSTETVTGPPTGGGGGSPVRARSLTSST